VSVWFTASPAGDPYLLAAGAFVTATRARTERVIPVEPGGADYTSLSRSAT
jgi:hypothetical protein